MNSSFFSVPCCLVACARVNFATWLHERKNQASNVGAMPVVSFTKVVVVLVQQRLYPATYLKMHPRVLICSCQVGG